MSDRSPTYYLAPECAEGPEASTPYSNLSQHEEWLGVPQVRVTVIEDATGSDYSGGTHTRSNYEVMFADPELRPHLIDLYGSHGTYGLAYRGTWDELRADPEREALRDAIAALTNYPILDDDHHSRMEADNEDAAWDEHGRGDFRKVLTRVMDELDPDHEHDLDETPDATIDELWRDGCEWLNVNGGGGCVHESCGVHFYTREWADKATSLGRDLGPEWARARRAELNQTLHALALATRVPESE